MGVFRKKPGLEKIKKKMGDEMTTSSPIKEAATSALESGMASLNFNEDRQGGGNEEHTATGQEGAGSKSKENRRRTASLERYRPGALAAGGTNEERERHRRRLGFGENRLPPGSTGEGGPQPPEQG